MTRPTCLCSLAKHKSLTEVMEIWVEDSHLAGPSYSAQAGGPFKKVLNMGRTAHTLPKVLASEKATLYCSAQRKVGLGSSSWAARGAEPLLLPANHHAPC